MTKPTINGIELDEKARLVVLSLYQNDNEATTSAIRELINAEYVGSDHSIDEVTRHHITYRIEEKLEPAGFVEKVGREKDVGGRNPANIYALTDDGRTFVEEYYDELQPQQAVTDAELSDALAEVKSALSDLEEEHEEFASQEEVDFIFENLKELGDTTKTIYEGMGETRQDIESLEAAIDVSEELDGLGADTLKEAIGLYREAFKALRDRHSQLQDRVEALESELEQRPTKSEVESHIEEQLSE